MRLKHGAAPSRSSVRERAVFRPNGAASPEYRCRSGADEAQSVHDTSQREALRTSSLVSDSSELGYTCGLGGHDSVRRQRHHEFEGTVAGLGITRKDDMNVAASAAHRRAHDVHADTTSRHL